MPLMHGTLVTRHDPDEHDNPCKAGWNGAEPNNLDVCIGKVLFAKPGTNDHGYDIQVYWVQICLRHLNLSATVEWEQVDALWEVGQL